MKKLSYDGIHTAAKTDVDKRPISNRDTILKYSQIIKTKQMYILNFHEKCEYMDLQICY